MIEEQPDLRFHIWTLGWLEDYPDPDNFMRVCPVSLVAGGQRQDEYDELVERARRSMNQEERIRLYKRADQILVEEAVIIPLTHSSNQLLVKPWLKNVIPPLLDQGPWKDFVIEPH
jgi:oligopeptide transport system substrate-binding protein